MKQLGLSIPFRDHCDFENFYAGDGNTELLKLLRTFPLSEQVRTVYVHGAPQSGRSHLLEATSQHAQANDCSSVYLPVRSLLATAGPEVLDGLEVIDVLCIDDVDAIAGRADWEEALFHLYNRGAQQQQRVLFSASTAPRNVRFSLRDLGSRLGASVVYRLQSLDDQDKLACLKLRAANLGMEINQQVAEYILRRSRRDLRALVEVVELLDSAALGERRQPSIPLVRQTMGW